MARISIKDLVKKFGAYTAVAGITLEIRDGEFLILVGPSGCGKTTTLNMISGLETPTSGEIAIGNTVVNDLEPASTSLRPEIAGALDALREAGAERALVTGSGPTAFGLFRDRQLAEQAHAALEESHPGAVLTAPLGPGEGTS